MALSDFEVRQTQLSDMNDLNTLYRQLTGIERSSQQYVWEWFEGYEGRAPSWVIVEKYSNRIAGHHGVIPVPLTYQGQQLRAARTENTMVHPDFRGKFPYHVVEGQLLKQLLQTYDAIFTTAGKGAQLAVRKRLGYFEAGIWHTNRLMSTPGYLARRLAAKAIRAKVGEEQITPQSHGDFIILTSAFTDFEQTLGQMPTMKGTVQVAADAEYFQWRLGQHPYAKRSTCVFSLRDMPGLAAWRTESRFGAVAVLIEYFACASHELEFWTEALTGLCRSLAHAAPVSVSLRCAANKGFLADVACRASRLGIPNEPTESAARLLVRSDFIPETAIWNASAMITQGI